MKRVSGRMQMFIVNRLKSEAVEWIDEQVQNVIPGIKCLTHFYTVDEAERLIKTRWGESTWERARTEEMEQREREGKYRQEDTWGT